METKKKILFTALLAASACICFFLLPLFTGLEKDTGLYAYMQGELNARLLTATKIFAVTKAAAGALSFLQNIRIDFNVVVAGLAISPLSVLEPISHTINSLSNLFLLAIGAIILEKILLTAGSFTALKVIIPLGVLFLALSLWITGAWRQRFREFAKAMLLAGAVVGLTVPLSIVFAKSMDNLFLKSMVTLAETELEGQSQHLGTIEKELAAPEGWLEKQGDGSWWSRAKDAVSLSSIRKKLEEVSARAANSTRDMAENMARVFASIFLTTVLIPLAAMFLLWVFLKRLFMMG